ncbi:MAG: PAS domain S-box protein [Candidatus Aminicenantes bacterium]|nr:MAG: PAS domain S-box protein [Candidatus Aminicenantes bacterium]
MSSKKETDDCNKTKEQLIARLSELRQRVAELEKNLDDITRNRKQARLKLLEERNRAQMYLDIAEVILVALDKNGNITLINRKGCRILGYENGALIGKNWFETCLPPHISDEVYDVFKQLMEGKNETVEYYENPVLTKSGEERLIAWHNVTLKNERGDILGTLSSGEDITERRQAEKALLEAIQFNRAVISDAGEGIIVYDKEFRYVVWNKFMEHLSGMPAEQVLGKKAFDLFPHLREQGVDKLLAKALSGQKARADDTPFYIPGTDKKGWVRGIYTPNYGANGEIIGIIGIVQDITERKQAEEKIKTSLKEKELLLKEVHHRVKNNMAVISSLLNLQTHSFKDPAVLNAFHDSRHRIRSMALVHEKLYQAKDLSKIDFPEYIRDLALQVSRSNEFRGCGVTVQVKAENIKMGIDNAIPCGLIINELLTNAFKYAFPKNQGGKIHVCMRLINNKYYELIVSDNGVGLPGNIDIQNPSSFGLDLVQLLTQQLEGEIEVKREKGTSFKITFQALRPG